VFQLPHRLGRYELVELLAIGGMAEIYRARIELPFGAGENELVVKRILPHLARNREFIDMFIDEARIVMPLSHGNIVQVFELGREGEDYFLVMEYLRGRNLETVLARAAERGQPFPLEAALFVASEIAGALDYAHRFRDARDNPAGIVHRDVSPQNILVGFQGEVKITDFGIARARSRIRSTSQGIIRGKASYLSPEQAECRELDGRSDVFSLGVVLYEMLSGRRPFEGPDEVATLELVRRAEFQPLENCRPDLEPGISEAVAKALRRDPAERFTDAGAFKSALSALLFGIAPDYTSARLAAWMRENFRPELEQEKVRRHSSEIAAHPASTVNLRKEENPSPTGSYGRWLLVPVVLGLAALISWMFGRAINPPLVPGAGSEPVLDAGVLVAEDGGESIEQRVPEDAGTLHAGDETRRLGRLDINSRPWTQVWLDGHRLPGETPFFKVPVPPGKHRLRFYNPELKMELTREVEVEAGGYQKVTVELTPP
jgi:serine/threonine protein kinase